MRSDRHEAQPGGEVPATGKGAQIGRKRHHRTSRHRSHSRHRAQAPHLDVLPRRVPQPKRQIVDLRREQIDLIEVKLGDLPYGVGNLGRPVLKQGRCLLEMGRPLRKDQSELSQVAPQRIDQLRALPHEALVRPECYGTRLMLGALHRYTMHVRTQHSFGDRRRVGRVVLLPLDERLHVDWRDQPDVVSAALRQTTPVVAGRTGFHRHDARLLRVQHLHQLCARQRSIE